MPFRHYLSLFVIALVICAALLGLAFEERIAGDSSGDPRAINPTGTDTLAGTWDTSYGPMTIQVTSVLHGGRIEKVTGSWQQRGNTGLITTGTYNRDTGVFLFQFNEPWNGSTGTARFALGPDDVLHGNWQFDGGGGGGIWTMQRPAPGAAASDPMDPLDCPGPPPSF